MWFADSVWCVRVREVSCDRIEERCCVRKVESVERESLTRRREAVSLEILKCEVHCAISWRGC